MTWPGNTPGASWSGAARADSQDDAPPGDDWSEEPQYDPVATLIRIGEVQETLAQQLAQVLAGLDRVAENLNPLLTEQYQGTQKRIRALEVRIRNRQERPLINRMADLLANVRRLDSGADIKTHVEETIIEALSSFGYEETGKEGEPFDPLRHEPVGGSAGRASVVAKVHQRGLASHGDVIKKARVDVAPAEEASPEHEPGPGTEPGAQSDQGATPA